MKNVHSSPHAVVFTVIHAGPSSQLFIPGLICQKHFRIVNSRTIPCLAFPHANLWGRFNKYFYMCKKWYYSIVNSLCIACYKCRTYLLNCCLLLSRYVPGRSSRELENCEDDKQECEDTLLRLHCGLLQETNYEKKFTKFNKISWDGFPFNWKTMTSLNTF